MSLKAQSRVNCAHCGTPFQPQKDEHYCCQGCAYVASLLEENGLERFYELKGGAVLPPVGSRVFHEATLDWLSERIEQAEASATGGLARAQFSIQGISCLGCVWLIEAVFQALPGAVEIQIDTRSALVQVHWEAGRFNAESFARKLAQLGYRLAAPDGKATPPGSSSGLSQRLGLSGFFLLNTMLFTLPGYLGMEEGFFLRPLFQILAAFFATLSLVVGGGYFFKRAWSALRHRRLHIDLPIALGLAAAYVGSLVGWLAGQANLLYFDFVATFTFLMLGGRWVQELALERSRAQLSKRQIGPGSVTLIGGAEDGKAAPVETLREGTDYAVAPGGVVPVASRLLDQAATISLEWINGEAEPLAWGQGQPLPAGAINVGLGSLRLRARERWGESLLARLLERPPESFRNARVERILAVYLFVVLLLALSGALTWSALGQPWTAFQVTISVLVVSCPCALGVALPLADEIAAGTLRRAGLFIKNTDIWERLRQVRCVVFDKTGTLTLETPRLLNPEVFEQIPIDSYNALHALVSSNLHPVARALRETLLTKVPSMARLSPIDQSCLSETVGSGVSWRDARGILWSLGRSDWAEMGQPGPSDAQAVLRRGDRVVAAFYLSEDVRDEAREACNALRERGLRVVLLSGDAEVRVRSMVQQLELLSTEARARCTPEEKAHWLETHARNCALMIGDGANDSLAFDAAVCRGTPVVDRTLLESAADFFFFGRSLRALPLLFRIGGARQRTVRVVFSLAVTYNLGAVLLSLSGAMHPLLAAILMPLSSLVTLAVTWTSLGRIK